MLVEAEHVWLILGTLFLALLWILVSVRIVLRPHREPASRVAWLLLVFLLPGVGVLAYFLLGETSIGHKRSARLREALRVIPPAFPDTFDGDERAQATVSQRSGALFHLGETISGFRPVGGNRAQILQDSNAAIDKMVADMDAAADHIHVLFYIWLQDGAGEKVARALIRAAGRGVSCRAMVDALGSRALVRSGLWREMGEAGVRLGVALPMGNPLLGPLLGRIDLRNHRKIVVVDNWITFCGSQNCADPEFRVKPRFAPWVDILVRFEGPIARQNQRVFVSDWMAQVDEGIGDYLLAPVPGQAEGEEGFAAQVIATGPTVRNSAMPETFETLMHTAISKLFITTPYYVPNESMQSALCAAAYRGVDVIVIFPARNDSWQVAAASRSYYHELLNAGVRIYEYEAGLLHAKTLTIDDDVALLGSANMDRRSFDLNYENNILLQDAKLSREIRERQEVFLAASRAVTLEDVESWRTSRRFWNNLMGMLGPVL